MSTAEDSSSLKNEKAKTKVHTLSTIQSSENQSDTIQARTLTTLERCFYAAGIAAFLWISIDHLFLYGQYFAHGGDQGVFDAFYLHVKEAERGADERFEKFWCGDKPELDACKKYFQKK